MSNLDQAKKLLDAPITADALHELDALCAKSHGDEAERIADLWEAALIQATQDVLDEYHSSVLGVV